MEEKEPEELPMEPEPETIPEEPEQSLADSKSEFETISEEEFGEAYVDTHAEQEVEQEQETVELVDEISEPESIEQYSLDV